MIKTIIAIYYKFNYLFIVLHVIDLSASRNTAEASSTITHSMQIIEIALDQTGPTASRNIAFMDKTKDLYVVPVRHLEKTFNKLGNNLQLIESLGGAIIQLVAF